MPALVCRPLDVVGQFGGVSPLGLRAAVVGSRETPPPQVILRLEPSDGAGLEHLPVADPSGGPAQLVVDDDDHAAGAKPAVDELPIRDRNRSIFNLKYPIRLTMSRSWFGSCM